MITKLRLVFSITIAFLSFYGSAQNGYWQIDTSRQSLNSNFSERFNIQKGKVFSFDEGLFNSELKRTSAAKGSAKVVYFPDANGVSVAFQVTEQQVLSPELSLKYPNIKSYAGYALNGSNDKIRFSVSHNGIQSMIVHTNKTGSTFMQKDTNDTYVVYERDPNSKANAEFLCNTKATLKSKTNTSFLKPIDGQVLRKFRLAVTASGEYTEYHGGEVADALAAINATVTRINEVFETDLGIRLELVANTDQVLFTNPDTDPYSGSLSAKVQAELTSAIGEENYDIGILFNKAPIDGNAGFIGAVCADNRKGSAYASTPNPEGDLFDLDFVAHEMGHQFGANHTWSFESEGTGVQAEPGSGTTIMGYAGISGIHNVANNGEDYFHYASIVQIAAYVQTISCGETITLTNVPPVIVPTGNFIIPVGTAFVLTAEATDANATDVLSFAWEQIDDGIVLQSTFGPTNLFGANFRSQKPSADPSRYFPKLSRVAAGELTQTSPTINTLWETVSTIEREMNFALTVRDNAIGGGQVVSDLVNVFVENSVGPFVVNSQSTNEVISAGATEEITWDVAGTAKSPINAQTVDIFLSTDGGKTFPNLLVENTPNDGSHAILMPAIATATARIMVKASDNIFFAVNASDFTIEESEIVLNFETLAFDVCSPDDIVVPFTYETYLGFNEEATFSVASPSGAAITISPATATTGNTAVEITFENTQNLPAGKYPITVLATTDAVTKETVFVLNVYDGGFEGVTLVSPANEEIDVSASSIFEWQADNFATSYAVEIAEDPDFNSIIETGSVLENSYKPTNLENLTTYYWRVKPNNSCGEGAFSSMATFTTIAITCETKAAIGLPAEISAIGTPTIFSKIFIAEDLLVADINVNLDLDHVFLADLVVTLTSPKGTTVVLVNNSCDALDNISATFDDDASDFVCGGIPAISGTVKPLVGFLSSFNGESTLGEWILTVSDKANSDGGSLKKFALDICAEGKFRPDADEDGVFDDGPDLCLGTPIGTQVNTSGCPVLVVSPSNYSIQARSESCRSNNDGAIEVNVSTALSYTAILSGNGVSNTGDFTAPSFVIDNLASGTYSLCITATDGTLTSSEQCFDLVVTEPGILSVASKASLNGSVVDLELDGAPLYNIELNGVVVQTANPNYSLNLKSGLNTLKVTTNLPCQGVYEEQFLFSNEPLVYPNPFNDVTNIFFGSVMGPVNIKIFDANGRFINSKMHVGKETELKLDLSNLSNGLYFIRFEGENIKGTSKVIKR